MALNVLTWVFYNSPTVKSDRLVLLALADNAHDDGAGAYPSVETLARKAGLSKRATQYALRSLEEVGAIEEVGKSRYGTTEWCVVMGGAPFAPPALGTAKGVQNGDGGGARTGPLGVQALAPEPSVGTAENLSPSSARESELFDGETTMVMGNEAATNAPLMQSPLHFDAITLHRQGTKVDGRKVTADEMSKAVDALDEFNAQADKSLSLGPHLTPIVGRVREVPAMTGGEHRKLVQSAFRIKWWEKGKAGSKRPLTPAVIYGSSKCFANIMSDQEEESQGTTRRGRFDRRSPVEGDDEHY